MKSSQIWGYVSVRISLLGKPCMAAKVIPKTWRNVQLMLCSTWCIMPLHQVLYWLNIYIWRITVFVCMSLALKCIWNEIFDNYFIGPFKSAFEDKTIAVYRLLISGLDPKLWRSEVVKIMNFRVKNGKKSGTKSIVISQIYDVTMFTCQIGDYSNRSISLVNYQNRTEFCSLMAQYKLR